MSTEEGRKRGYASPPCFMHEPDPACGGFGKTEDPALRSDVMRWRKAERTAERLDALLVDVAGSVVSGYWPIKKGTGDIDWEPMELEGKWFYPPSLSSAGAGSRVNVSMPFEERPARHSKRIQSGAIPLSRNSLRAESVF